MCPVGFGLTKEKGHVAPHELVCHVLLVETNDGLVLVDTGFGTGDVERPGQLGPGFAAIVRPELDPRETAVAQVERLGFSRDDVRHVIPTHLDLDHAGGLPDFPLATVHVYAAEVEAALRATGVGGELPRGAPRAGAEATLPEKMRYRPAHFSHHPRWARYEVRGERFKGLECVRQLEGLPPEILLVPTVGHTRGHVAVVIDQGDGFLIHAGDAYFHRREMDPERPWCPLPLRAFQSMVAFDDAARVANRERLRQLAREPDVKIFCAHDPVELLSFASA